MLFSIKSYKSSEKARTVI